MPASARLFCPSGFTKEEGEEYGISYQHSPSRTSLLKKERLYRSLPPASSITKQEDYGAERLPFIPTLLLPEFAVDGQLALRNASSLLNHSSPVQLPPTWVFSLHTYAASTITYACHIEMCACGGCSLPLTATDCWIPDRHCNSVWWTALHTRLGKPGEDPRSRRRRERKEDPEDGHVEFKVIECPTPFLNPRVRLQLWTHTHWILPCFSGYQIRLNGCDFRTFHFISLSACDAQMTAEQSWVLVSQRLSNGVAQTSSLKNCHRGWKAQVDSDESYINFAKAAIQHGSNELVLFKQQMKTEKGLDA
ncbi:hypothetical protein BDZ97DRAFT_1772008, partial [Flammula alnicola]